MGRRRTRARLDGDAPAVSPVVGFILILAISVASVASVVKWGIPAIDEMKASVELRTMHSQLTNLNSDLRELASGSAGKTAKRWEAGLDRGRLHLEPNSHLFALVVNAQEVQPYSKRVPQNNEPSRTGTTISHQPPRD